jgi:hypothetical protein
LGGTAAFCQRVEDNAFHLCSLVEAPIYFLDLAWLGAAAAGTESHWISGADLLDVFTKSPHHDHDSDYFYGVLPAPSQPGK